MGRVYYFIFYCIYRFFESISRDNLSDWKAGLVIEILEISLLVTIIGQLEIIKKISIVTPVKSSYLILPVVLLAFINYWTFLKKKGWKRYESEFQSYSRPQKVIFSTAVILIILLIVTGLIFTFYQYSQIDWKRYE
jgi:cytochrome b subunit of formate dehydrogenase